MSMETERTEIRKEENSKEIRTRRVGSVTFGLTLICFGVMFLLHIVIPA